MKTGRLPIVAVDGNLVARDWSDIWAIFALRTRSYRAEPARRQQMLATALESFALNAQADFQILRVSRRFDAGEYAHGLRQNMPVRAHRNLYNAYIERQRQQLEGLQAWRPATFVCMRLADPDVDLQGHASRLFERSRQDLWHSLRRRRLSRSVGERARLAEARVTDHLEARPASQTEVCWLIGRAFRRGIAEPDGHHRDWAEPQRVDRLFGEDVLERHERYVRCLGEYGDSYQAGLCLGEMGHGQPFTRQVELMFTPLEEHPWPVDASLNVRWVPNDQALRRVTRQVARTDNQLRDEEASAHGARDEGRRRAQLSDELHSRLTATGEPLLMGTLSLIVPAADENELQNRVRTVRERFPWSLRRPYGDQLDVWLSHLPGQPPLVRGFERPFTGEQVGTFVPHATHEAGSTGGLSFYIGHSLHGKQPILFDLSEGTMTEKAPTIALCGSLGGGKTIALQLLMYQAFLQGARIVDIDPKSTDHLFHRLPEVRDHVQEITIGPDDRYAGMLDPLRVAPLNERHEAACTYLTDILRDPSGDVESAINGAIVDILAQDQERACCMEVIAALESSQSRHWQEVGLMLRPYSQSGLARLGFANADDPLPRESEAQVTYLAVRSLKRAAIKTVRSELSLGQRWGRAILQLVALYAMRILGTRRDQLKVLAFDEASFLAEDAVGKQLLDQLARWGRSEWATPILSTQNLADVDDQSNLIGSWFQFGVRSRDEAMRSLRARELDETGPLVEALTGRYERGKALFRDIGGRCEELQIDCGNWGLLQALEPKKTDASPEEQDMKSELASRQDLEAVS